MRTPISEYLRKLSYIIDNQGFQGDSPYINMPDTYFNRIPQSHPYEEVQLGPPSLYNDFDSDDRLKNKEDIRRQQGDRPEVDIFNRHTKPVTETDFGNVREDAYGNPGIMPMYNENRDTYSIADDYLTGNPYA